jgi:NAD(P)-dependent dehydrogenase (short-subunit alcohol dehydrogenase family)
VKLDGTVALVFGGGGLLGSATARRLCELGASVVVADIDPGRLSTQIHGGAIAFVRADVTDEGEVDSATSAAGERGELRVVVNCAGAGIVERTLSRDGTPHSLDSFRSMIELNLIGNFLVLRAAATAMSSVSPGADGERGVIVTTASVAGLEGSAGQLAYGAAKAGVAGMTLPAARDLAPLGIRVVTIAPGGMADPADVDLADPRIAALVAGVVFPPRFGRPEEYALTVTQLIENPYLNGMVLRLDGGARLGKKF